jgi:pimeloyl-ACP methyl ester carboxylesterase
MKKVALTLVVVGICSIALSKAQNRPQEPTAPFSYHAEEVVFENTADSLQLAGTFTYPKTGISFPAVVLINGSGPQDRNSELMGHKPFLVLADYLTKHGIAVLRVDDRGTGQSEGNYNDSGLEDFVRDTESALHYLQNRKEIDPAKVGLIGHSLGGIIAPILAGNPDHNIAFTVLLAAPGVPGNELMLLQKELIERKMGVPELGVAQGQAAMRGAYDIIIQSAEPVDSLQSRLKNYFTGIWGGQVPEAQLDMIARQLGLPWLTDLIRYDPQPALSQTTCPVLALNGANDLQVPAEQNLKAIETILQEAGNNNVTIKELEGLNHLFQESKTGLPAEYAQIEQTFSRQALEFIKDWVLVVIEED